MATHSQSLPYHKKPWYWYIIVLISLAGLIYQVQDLIFAYLQYETITELLVTVPVNLTAPALSICFPYKDVLDRVKTNAKYPDLSDKETLRVADVEQLFTVTDILAFTPDVDKLVVSCQWKIPRSYTRNDKRGSCEAVFLLEKFFKQQYVCIMVQLVPGAHDTYGFDYIQNSLLAPGMFYEVSLNSSYFTHATDFQAIIHSPTVRPRGNKAFPIALSRVAAKIPFEAAPAEPFTVLNSYFFLSYSTYVNRLLGYPFKTNCLDYQTVSFESQEHCIDDCVTTKITGLRGKVPFTTVIIDPVDLKVVTTVDNSDAEYATEIYQIRLECGAQCNQPNCVEEIYVTKFIRGDSSDDLTFRVYVANEPTLESVFKQKTSISEFLIQLLTCFGIWFGISLYSFIAVIESLGRFVGSGLDGCLAGRRARIKRLKKGAKKA